MKIFCVSGNYSEPLANGHTLSPQRVVYSLRPDSCLLRNNQPFFYPALTADLRCGVAVVVRVSRLGKSIAVPFAHRYYDALALGVHFTAHDLLGRCQAEGLPWEPAQAFDGSAAIGRFVPLERLPPAHALPFRLERNGQPVQQGCTSQLRVPADGLIAHLSRHITLRTGDLIYTGTPGAAVPVAIGDRLKGYIGEGLMLDFFVR